MAYGMPADAVDEYVRIGESTTIEALQRFCRAIVGVYEEEYLRSPNGADISRLLREGERRGFPGRAPPANYTINGHRYTMGYYLTDGIYPPWATLVQAIREPRTAKKKRFTMMRGIQKRCRAGIWSVTSSLCHCTWSSTLLVSGRAWIYHEGMYYFTQYDN
ncbi:hypothetical protein Dimus_039187 [Dionaea muscipula]